MCTHCQIITLSSHPFENGLWSVVCLGLDHWWCFDSARWGLRWSDVTFPVSFVASLVWSTSLRKTPWARCQVTCISSWISTWSHASYILRTIQLLESCSTESLLRIEHVSRSLLAHLLVSNDGLMVSKCHRWIVCFNHHILRVERKTLIPCAVQFLKFVNLSPYFLRLRLFWDLFQLVFVFFNLAF